MEKDYIGLITNLIGGLFIANGFLIAIFLPEQRPMQYLYHCY